MSAFHSRTCAYMAGPAPTSRCRDRSRARCHRPRRPASTASQPARSCASGVRPPGPMPTATRRRRVRMAIARSIAHDPPIDEPTTSPSTPAASRIATASSYRCTGRWRRPTRRSRGRRTGSRGGVPASDAICGSHICRSVMPECSSRMAGPTRPRPTRDRRCGASAGQRQRHGDCLGDGLRGAQAGAGDAERTAWASACERPRRCASRIRRSACGTLRSLPVRPISPNATSGPVGRPRWADAIAIAIARSAAGSCTSTPPATLTNTSAEPSGSSAWRCEHGEDHREAVAVDAGGEAPRHLQLARRDQRLHLEQQRPRALDGAGDDRARPAADRRGRAAPTGRRPGRAPCDVISNTPISAVEPNRFLTARSTRRSPVRSPSNISTASTRCSSTRGPATRAVLGHVTDQHHVMRVLLGDAQQTAGGLAHLRDGAGRRREVVAQSVCTESTTATAGFSCTSVWQTRSRSVSAITPIRPAPPMRSARMRTCAGDSSPHTSSTGCRGGEPRQRHGGERRLADARIAADQDQRAGDEPAAEHAIELVDARGQPVLARRLDVGQRLRPAHLAGARTARRAPRAATPPRPSTPTRCSSGSGRATWAGTRRTPGR